jgi:hypothetical protein
MAIGLFGAPRAVEALEQRPNECVLRDRHSRVLREISVSQ